MNIISRDTFPAPRRLPLRIADLLLRPSRLIPPVFEIRSNQGWAGGQVGGWVGGEAELSLYSRTEGNHHRRHRHLTLAFLRILSRPAALAPPLLGRNDGHPSRNPPPPLFPE